MRRWLGEEASNLVRALLRQDRAGDVDQPSARLHQRCGEIEQARCSACRFGDIVRPEAPFRIRPAPPDARARAGRIDQHDVEARARARQCRPSPAGAPARCGRRLASAARRSAAGAPCRGRRRRFGRVLHRGGHAPASCRRRLRRGRAPAARGAAPASSAAIWRALVLHLVPAFAVGGLGLHVGLAAGPSGAGSRTPTGDSAVAVGSELRQRLQHLVAVAFSVLTRRSTGARCARAAPSSAPRRRTRARTTASSHSGSRRAPSRCVLRHRPRTGPRSSAVAAPARARRRRPPRQWPPAPSPGPAGAPGQGARRSLCIRAAIDCAGAGRHTRGCRRRPGRPSRRSGWICPSRQGRRTQADTAAIRRREPRRPIGFVLPAACLRQRRSKSAARTRSTSPEGSGRRCRRWGRAPRMSLLVVWMRVHEIASARMPRRARRARYPTSADAGSGAPGHRTGPGFRADFENCSRPASCAPANPALRARSALENLFAR